MKILFVCHRLPYPPNRGGKIRSYNMIGHLSEKHSVVVASLAHTEQELREGEGLKNHCEEVIAEVLPDRSRWLHAVNALPTKTPSSVAYFWSPRLYSRIRERLVRNQFDVIFVHCAFVAQYVADWRNGFRVLDFGDMDSAKWAEYAQSRAFPLSLGYALEAKKLRAYERRLAQNFDRCTVTTQGEREEFDSLGVLTPCTVIPNGVDTGYFSQKQRSAFAAPVVVFLGRMDYFPNIDGVLYFARKVFPLIRERVPDAQFRIIGSDPASTIRELEKMPGISVTGYVPDVRSYLTDAAVSVAPLRIARGTQNKILESMSMGIPVVSTPQAAKGIQAVPGQHLVVAGEPEAFAKSVLELLWNDGLRRKLANEAQRNLDRVHKWPLSMQILDELLKVGNTKEESFAGLGS
jgi:sugar transferase (PEP-CTERM/EpsH1 system associated)